MGKLTSTLARLLPEKQKGMVEYHVFPNRGEKLAGPFNGQCFRQVMFIDLVRACEFVAVAETGTFRGATTRFMALNAGCPVHTVEIIARNHGFATRRLRDIPKIRLNLGDSRSFLKNIELPKGPVFFYLDAHWYTDLPLKDEVDIIASRFESFAIMIDDFEVPGDADYNFDNYGPGKKLSLDDFPFQNDPRLQVFFPNRAGRDESGARRGSVVLISPSLSSKVAPLGSLRHFSG